MRVFITGATGFIGSRVTDLLLEGGHDVFALVRSQRSADAAKRKGVEVVGGSLEDLSVISDQAAVADATIHTAFNVDHTLSNWEEAHALDTEQLVTKGAEHGIRTCVLRLPLHVYDQDGSGFTKVMEKKALESGHAVYFGQGQNEASNVHVDDAAQLFICALKHAKPGSLYNGASGVASGREIAEAIANKHGLPASDLSFRQQKLTRRKDTCPDISLSLQSD
ncbi:hypothetical protein WJX73_002791 [Symbiochloris irregularis]|uniref:Uncharacterized protein n=1 Tax=Symbiochloris irregularis TaxID=706552 RepID=A0AAW1PIU9_9CHLO